MRDEKNKVKKTKSWEVAVVAALTALFVVLACVNLGSLELPSSCWQPQSSSGEEEVVLDFGSVQEVKEIYIFLADERRTKFECYESSGRRVLSYDNDPAKNVHFCSWDRQELSGGGLENTSTRSLRLVFDAAVSDGKVGEILVVSAEGKKIAVSGGEGAAKLVDEQELVELPVTQKDGAYFDEMYFVRTARQHLNLEEPYEWTHPPLGKLAIAGGILLFGFNPFGWRILGVLAAAAMIPIIFLLGRRLFKSSAAGVVAAFLLTFDFMHFSLARLATGETYLALFSLLMFFFAFDYFASSTKRTDERTDERTSERTSRSLLLSLLFFGLGFAVKWTAVFGLAAVLVLWLVCNFKERRPILKDCKVVVAGLLVSAAIYIATYLPYIFSGAEGGHGGGHGLADVFDLQLRMFGYHAGIEATHPFSSPWWSWPLLLKPLWVYSNNLGGGTVSTTVLMGNPAIWWCGTVALVFLAVRFVAGKLWRKGKEGGEGFVALFILVPFLLQWLPYALITRILFIYHFVPNVPFLILGLTYWLNIGLEKDAKRNKIIVVSFLVLVAALFFLFYPVISGYPVAFEFKESLRWLKGWTF